MSKIAQSKHNLEFLKLDTLDYLKNTLAPEYETPVEGIRKGHMVINPLKTIGTLHLDIPQPMNGAGIDPARQVISGVSVAQLGAADGHETQP